MIFIQSNYEDISRYFRGTFVKFGEYGDKLFFIHEVSSREISGETEDNSIFKLYLSDEHPYEVEFVLPKKSFFQFGKYAAYLYRIPAKQYRRGICKDNTCVYLLNQDGVKAPKDLGFDLLRAYVNKQKYASLMEAVSNKEKNSSYALSQRMAYVCRTKCIFIDDEIVAQVVVGKEKAVKLINPVFKPEIEELTKGSIFEGAVV